VVKHWLVPLFVSCAACTERGAILELEAIADSGAPNDSAIESAAEDAPAISDVHGDANLGLAVVLVDAQNPVHANDALLEDHLRQFGFSVEERASVDPVDAGEGIALVVLSSSLLTAQLDASLPDQPIPMVVLESFSYAKLGMTGPMQDSDFGVLDGSTIDVEPGPFSPMSTGSVIVHMPASAINYGRPASSAVVGARLTGFADAASTFGYEAGATMVGRTAAARRVGVFLRTGTINSLTPDGWDLFEAASRWAAAR
jgi:hypothetical protein